MSGTKTGVPVPVTAMIAVDAIAAAVAAIGMTIDRALLVDSPRHDRSTASMRQLLVSQRAMDQRLNQ